MKRIILVTNSNRSIKCEICKKETRTYLHLKEKKVCPSCFKRKTSKKRQYQKGICEECKRYRTLGWHHPEKKMFKICGTCYLKLRGKYLIGECSICGKEPRVLLNRVNNLLCCSTCYKQSKKRGKRR